MQRQTLQDLRLESKMQRQREKEKASGVPHPSPVASVAASEDGDAKTANSRMSQISGSQRSRTSVLSQIATAKSEEKILTEASLRSSATKSAKVYQDGLPIYEKVGGNLSEFSVAADSQARSQILQITV